MAFDKLVQDGVAIYAGKTKNITLPANAPEITYESSNPEVATVENGIITALSVGETEITAS
ncbi:MAG: Ig-like domain-containing protein [Muribaculaceae bacterium]|nr:Ig-like domain-containing protein [Muribaculaceae bacterium]